MGRSEEAPTFAIVGAGGFVAPRHLAAIRANGGRIVAASDPCDSVGILDSYGYQIEYFRKTDRLWRYLLQRDDVGWVSVCSPNYLHRAHVLSALMCGCNVIVEKPAGIGARELHEMRDLAAREGLSVNCVLQLRHHPELLARKQGWSNGVYEVVVEYVTPRGRWYENSWKTQTKMSGGILYNLGVHLFDALLWLFGEAHGSYISTRERDWVAGELSLERANVRWMLTTRDVGARRVLRVDGEEIQLDGFTNLHNEVYAKALAGSGVSVDQALPAIELIARMSTK